MLSEVIKRKIEDKANLRIRYSKDCDVLSSIIKSECNASVSPSSLKRLFGFVKGVDSPRAHTLDIIAGFLGHSCYDDLIKNMVDYKASSKIIRQIDCQAVKKESIFLVRFGSARIEVKCISKYKFEVLSQVKTEFQPGDTLHVKNIELNLPLLVSSFTRQGVEYAPVILGKITGVSEITQVKPKK